MVNIDGCEFDAKEELLGAISMYEDKGFISKNEFYYLKKLVEEKLTSDNVCYYAKCCPNCGGDGKFMIDEISLPCTLCEGTGKVMSTKHFT